MSTPQDWSYLETNTSQQPLDSQPTKPKSSKLSWEDFSMFYRTANDWDYPVDETKLDEDTKNTNEDMFKNHGSHHSMDILADEMSTKWSYNMSNESNNPPNNNNNNIPINTTPWQNTLSTQAQTSITAQQRMENFLDEEEENNVLITKNASITDSQGIDISSDTNIILMTKLKEYINKLECENNNLKSENKQLKKRNSELRKTLHKAQKYRRKSSIAVANLIKINDEINTLQTQTNSNENESNINEEKVREEEELNNLKIQEQIQQAISMFQEEFGAELDEELNNIQSFQYDSLPEQSGDEMNENVNTNNTFHFETSNTNQINNNFFNNAKIMQTNNTTNFAIKFTDANSNQNSKITDANSNHKNKYIDDNDNDNDALPGSYTTPGGPNDDYVTPGGPEMDMKVGNDMNNNEMEMDMNMNLDGIKLKEMEMRLNDLSDKMLGLMERIQDLTDTNQHLEVSKLELITNTCNAMNQYRDTIKRLSKENQMLIDRIKAV